MSQSLRLNLLQMSSTKSIQRDFNRFKIPRVVGFLQLQVQVFHWMMVYCVDIRIFLIYHINNLESDI